jgi:hypothetical protein
MSSRSPGPSCSELATAFIADVALTTGTTSRQSAPRNCATWAAAATWPVACGVVGGSSTPSSQHHCLSADNCDL